MISVKVLQNCIRDYKELFGTDCRILSPEGKLLAGPSDLPDPSGCLSFEVRRRGRLMLLIEVSGAGEYASSCGILLSRQLAAFLELDDEKNNKETFLLRLMNREIDDAETAVRAKKHRIALTADRAVFLIRSDAATSEELLPVTRPLTGRDSADELIMKNDHLLVWIRALQDPKDRSRLLEIAQELADFIVAEAMVPVRVSVSPAFSNLSGLPAAFRQAEDAMEIGRFFYPERTVISYDRLGIGGLLYRVPKDACRAFIKEMFPKGIPAVLDEETLTVIRTYFNNDLNLSETARQLYMHRSTLLYKLEKLADSSGIDVRKFNDAVALQIALLIAGHPEDCPKIN